jgi:hypothetical protein
VDIDFDHQVSIEVASAAGTIRIRNNNYLGTRSGNVTLVW